MKKTLCTLYKRDDWDAIDPLPDPNWKLIYGVWLRIAKKNNFEIHRAALPWYKNGKITKSWRLTPTGWFERNDKPFTPTVIYDRALTFDKKTGQPDELLLAKKNEIFRHIDMVNPPQFSQLLENKLYQSVVFHDVMLPSRYLPAGSVYHRPNKDPIVIKALGGLGGDYVRIENKDSVKVEGRSIVQGFIHARKNGEIRDYRIHFVGEEPQYIYSRIAGKGSYYTNVHFGGTMEWLKLSDEPDLIAFAKKITHRLRVFPKKFYTLDFMYDLKRKQYVLVELNSMPGTDEFTPLQHEHLLTNMTKIMFNK